MVAACRGALRAADPKVTPDPGKGQPLDSALSPPGQAWDEGPGEARWAWTDGSPSVVEQLQPQAGCRALGGHL